MLKQPLPARTRRLAGSMLVALIVGGGTWAAWAAQPATATKAAPATNEAIPADAVPLTHITQVDRLTPPTWPAGVAKTVSGSVVIELLVGSDGNVKDVKVVRSQPAGVFDAAAIQTARSWYVHAPIENGVPVARRWRTQIDFLPDEPKQD